MEQVGRVTIRIERLPEAGDLPLPAYSTEHASGMDLAAALDSDLTIAPGQRALVPTGFRIEIPIGYEGQIRPRSGLALKHGISVPNAPGTIDADYRGELKVILVNLGDSDFVVHRADRIAQLVIAPVVQAVWQETADLARSARSDGGFGHTGV